MTQILSSLILLPIIGTLYLLLFVKKDNIFRAKSIALAFSTIELVLACKLFFLFDEQTSSYQFVENIPWIEGLHLNYMLGIDGISLMFIMLTAILTPICIISSFSSIKEKVREFMIMFLILESLVIGVFAASNMILFYVFFEAVLIPMYFIIGVWGGKDRIYASYKFFLYTLLGSLFMLIAMIYIYSNVPSMDFEVLNAQLPLLNLSTQKYLWLCFFIAFAIKVPMWPVHTWLPDAHVQAPTAGSVILAGILLKMGGYGLLRVCLPMFPDASFYFRELVFVLSIIAIIYASLVAFAQTDIKKLIAYSSIAHMGYVTFGIFANNIQSLSGAMLQMISHGLISGALFLSVGVIYDRLHTREISEFGGIVSTMPRYGLIFMFFTMASIGLPGTSGFVSEFVTLVGGFKASKLAAIVATSGVVLGAIYMLSLYKRMMFGEITNENINGLKDLTRKEMICFAPLVILVLLIGVYPSIITNKLSLPLLHLTKSEIHHDIHH